MNINHHISHILTIINQLKWGPPHGYGNLQTDPAPLARQGFSFGAPQSVAGEVVFNTGMAPGTAVRTGCWGVFDGGRLWKKTRLVRFYMGLFWFDCGLFGSIGIMMG